MNDFVKKAIDIHGDKYDYSHSIYINSRSHINILCKKHGLFSQRANNHLAGQGCPKCKCDTLSERFMLGTERFISSARELYGDKYNYDSVAYFNSNTKVIIKCIKHGKFEQTPIRYLKGYGCPTCSAENSLIAYDDFLAKSRLVHGDLFRYTFFENKKFKDKIEIICPKHGEFSQSISSHLRGHGCKQCSHHIDSPQEKIDRFNAIHNNKYKYVLNDGVKDSSKIIIICDEHGEFMQTVNNHLAGHGCPQCNMTGGHNKLTTQEFIKRAMAVHGSKYMYDKSDYQSYSTGLIIECREHGEFIQSPSNHLAGNGCSRCALERAASGMSLGQKEIYDLCSQYDKPVLNDRDILDGQEIDIYCPNHKIAIEYHGMYYHSYAHKESKKQRYKHHAKADLAIAKGITLIQIMESEWKHKPHVVTAILRSKFGDTKRIYARQCTVSVIDRKLADSFISEYHIQGSRHATVNIGIFYGDDLMSCMTFSRKQKAGPNDYELIRLCSRSGYTVVGGSSKMLNHFAINFKPSSVFTFADRRYSVGNVYTKMGLSMLGVTDPGYGYTKSGKWYSRQKFQKHKLHNVLENYDPESTESENMFFNGYRRIWDAGHWRFILNYNEDHID
jgi:hypothetical protein